MEEKKRRSALAELRSSIEVGGVDFGRLEEVQGAEVFSPEAERRWSNGSLVIDGEKRCILMRSAAEVNAPTLVVHIHSILSARIIPGHPPSILLLLSTPPTCEGDRLRSRSAPSDSASESIFQSFAQMLGESGLLDSRPSRLRALDDDLARIIPFVGTHLRILFPSNTELDQLKYRKSLVRLPKIGKSQIAVERRHLYSVEALAKLDSLMARLDIRIAFQVSTSLKAFRSYQLSES